MVHFVCSNIQKKNIYGLNEPSFDLSYFKFISTNFNHQSATICTVQEMNIEVTVCKVVNLRQGMLYLFFPYKQMNMNK